MKQFKLDKTFNYLIFIPIISYIIGFLLNENSANSGIYKGVKFDFATDVIWIKKNIEIFLNNDLINAIKHPDLFGNRTPIVYVLNKIFNPFFSDFDKYRIVVFSLSLMGPILFYFFLKIKFYNIDKRILFLIASCLFLSPYYRTSGYWGLNENYGIISFIISFLFLELFQKSKKETKRFYFYLILTIFFSSLSVYFDHKFLIVPLTCFLKIIFTKHSSYLKVFTILLYTILSLPFVYLIILWKGIVPPLTQAGNPNTITAIEDIYKIYFIHLGYASTIIAFYLFPLIKFIDDNIFKTVLVFLKKRKNLIFLSIGFLYVLLLFLFFDFKKFVVDDYWVGNGMFHKISIILSKDIIIQMIITYSFFLGSWFIILVFFDKRKKDFIYILYIYFLSLLLWPLMQEYFDPTIMLFVFFLFKPFKYMTINNSIFYSCYLGIFLIAANLYYY